MVFPFMDVTNHVLQSIRLNHSIALYNANRQALGELYELRAAQPHRVPTSELYLLLRAGNVLDSAALDKYSFVRDAYLQRRQNLIYNGEPPDYDESLWMQPDITGLALADRALPAPALMWSAGGPRAVAPGVKVASLGSDLPVLPLVPSLNGPTDEELAGLRAEPELR